MRKYAGWIGFMGFLMVIALASADAQFGGGRGGRGGGMSRSSEQMEEMRNRMEALRAFPVEVLWTGLSFGIDLPDEKLMAIRPLVAEAWAKKRRILEAAQDSRAWEGAKEELEDLNKDLEKKLEVILSKDQRKALEELVKQQARMAGSAGRF